MNSTPPNWHFSIGAPICDALSRMLNRSYLVSALNLDGDCRVLDVGGGSGTVSEEVVPDRYSTWTILDLNRAMIDHGTHRRPELTFVRGSALQLPFRQNRFDRIVIADALHHMPGPDEVFAECHRVLRPDGRFVIEEINPDDPIGNLVETGEWMAAMGSRFFSIQPLQTMLEQNGFRVIKKRKQQSLYYLVTRPET